MKTLIKSILIMLLLTVGASQSFAEQKITFYHYDLLGSPVATTDKNGAVIWREEYGPWGEKLLKEDEALDNIRGYTGHVNDKETGLTYMQARYYDPQIGRFMGVDPVGFQENNPISFNRYNYANNNPYKFTDPNGETPLGEELDQLNEMEAKDNAEKEAWAEILDDPEKQKEYIDNRIKNNVIGLGLMALGMTKITTPKTQTQSLFHYTDAKGLKGILESKTLKPSLKANNPKDARYGNGQYLSDIAPKTKTSGQLSRAFLGQPFQGNKFSHYVEINTTGLKVVKGREGVFVNPSNNSLNLKGRIIRSGKN